MALIVSEEKKFSAVGFFMAFLPTQKRIMALQHVGKSKYSEIMCQISTEWSEDQEGTLTSIGSAFVKHSAPAKWEMKQDLVRILGDR
ncbi:Uncharacterized protein TCM_015284 [Theobroma cacao]|uniref:Uncharacterized protein n=1 Tax=Theobroma cacao TaxID=3641 RepID=A0A061G2C7_THECC|nr:Uncharacterized protein TCM_015284 [Theobroma cacao]